MCSFFILALNSSTFLLLIAALIAAFSRYSYIFALSWGFNKEIYEVYLWFRLHDVVVIP